MIGNCFFKMFCDSKHQLERCEFGGVIVIGSIGEQNGLDVHIVEGLNVITVLNVIIFRTKCNKVLNVITYSPKCNKVINVKTFSPKCNKPPMQSLYSFSALLL